MTAHGYTVFRVLDGGRLPLRRLHAERLGRDAGQPLARFATTATPGIYRATWDGERLGTTRRGPSRLTEGLPCRLLVSPFAGARGRFAKPAPPSPYDTVRLDGVVTLLTDLTSTELYESCVAGLVAWDGQGFVVAPADAPAVASVAERAIIEHLAPRHATLEVASGWPLLLVNAAVGTCAPSLPGRAPFPPEARARLDALLASEDA
jgi:hypothetical protein